MTSEQTHGESVAAQVEDVRYRPISATSSSDALQRIRRWLADRQSPLADLFKPPATPALVSSTENLLGLKMPKSLREAYLTNDGTERYSNVLIHQWGPIDTIHELVAGHFFSQRPDAARLIPFMTSDDGLFFTEAVTDPEDDRPVWVWLEGARHQDVKIADSFGAFLTQLVEGLDAEDVIIHPETSLSLTWWDEIYGQMSKAEAHREFPDDFA